ncbi:hypothetical protein B0H13DRAFT_2666016 [Mycena leptocephala]|nr:hypothetical protein B0H13DRAFT_2666016 [Mycena leptocephala]
MPCVSGQCSACYDDTPEGDEGQCEETKVETFVSGTPLRSWKVTTSQDLVLDAEQTEVSMAVDMEIARRAAVFVGNGWSSFTSNIVYQRLLDKRDPVTIRFT